ncbi:cell division protein FtsQ/DivIB [Pseudotenacibaculum sp. MALMAid0570]|uniref:cell division protein FtsQ/DivIB n=1 Tax=Pseudotenacibaculum sp. MALMAid0570 TaxID=3143938 RepID=UPI0032DFCE57
MKLKKTLKYLLLLILLGSLGFLYSFSNVRNGEKIVRKIEVKFQSEENNFLTHAMVNKLLIQNNEAVENQAKSVIDLYRLEKEVLKNPYIEKASLFITIDGVLNSLIKQRKPVARVITSSKTYYLDSQGVEVPLSENYSARVPLITGVKKDEDLGEVNRLLEKIIRDDFLKKEIIGIHFDNSNECLLTVRSGNYKVELGELTELDQKFRKLKAFYNKTFLDSTIHKYKTINIKYHNQVVGVK